MNEIATFTKLDSTLRFKLNKRDVLEKLPPNGFSSLLDTDRRETSEEA